MKLSEVIMMILSCILSVAIFIYWVFNPSLTTMQVMIKFFWYVLILVVVAVVNLVAMIKNESGR